MRRSLKFTILFLAILLFSVLFIKNIQCEENRSVISSEYRLFLRADSLISIDGNGALNYTASSGNGTSINPYIIENKIIIIRVV